MECQKLIIQCRLQGGLSSHELQVYKQVTDGSSLRQANSLGKPPVKRKRR